MFGKVIHEKKWCREPESGWDLQISHNFFAQIVYNFKNEYFEKIIINSGGKNDFDILFRKPRTASEFEEYLKPFDLKYNEIEKCMSDYSICHLQFNQLTEILESLNKNNYISDMLLQDIKLAISPDNLDLNTLELSKEQALKPKPSITYGIGCSPELQLNENLISFSSNKNMGFYTMEEDHFSWGLFNIQNWLNKNANPNYIIKNKNALMALVKNQRCNEKTEQIANLLLQYGAEINAVNNKGQSALHFAASNSNPSWIVYLLEKGIDASLVDNSGFTAENVYLKKCKMGQEAADPSIINLFIKNKCSALPTDNRCFF